MYITGNNIIGLKEEASFGTYVDPVAGTDFNICMKELGTPEINYNYNRSGNCANGNIMPSQTKSGKASFQVTGQTHLQYSGDETVAPKNGLLFRSAGFVESGGDALPIVYTYDGSVVPDIGLSLIMSIIKRGSSPASIDVTAAGIQSNMVISAGGVGEEVVCEHTLQGAFVGEVDNADPVKTLSGTDTGVTSKFLGGNLTMGSVTYVIQSFSLDLGNSIAMVNDPGSNKGLLGQQVTAADPTFTFSAQKLPLSTTDQITDVENDTVFTDLSLTLGNWTLTIPDGNFKSKPTDSDLEGIVGQDFEIEAREIVLTQAD